MELRRHCPGLVILFLGGILVRTLPVLGQSSPKDHKDIDLVKLGILAVEAKKDAKTGFVVGGKNSTALIHKLTEINGLKVARLEAIMRPKKLSQAGFLGEKEKLLDVLAADNQHVVDEMGLTHQELARHLHAMGAIPLLLAKKGEKSKPVEFVYHGRRYRARREDTRGAQPSPFEDDTKSGSNVEVQNLENHKKIRYGLLVPYMIERYGFYEGKGTPYRVEPGQVLEVFDFLKERVKKK